MKGRWIRAAVCVPWFPDFGDLVSSSYFSLVFFEFSIAFPWFPDFGDLVSSSYFFAGFL